MWFFLNNAFILICVMETANTYASKYWKQATPKPENVHCLIAVLRWKISKIL